MIPGGPCRNTLSASELYSISLDHLLMEDNSMDKKQTYLEYLEESTNTVKAKRNLEKVILFTACFLVWTAAEVIFWLVRGPMTAYCGVAFRWILLPLLTIAATAIIARNDYWGRANWFSVLAAAVIFFTIPYTHFGAEGIAAGGGTLSSVFIWPNLGYMAVGAVLALCGIGIGSFMRSRIIHSAGSAS